jgi:hypothetical protein
MPQQTTKNQTYFTRNAVSTELNEKLELRNGLLLKWSQYGSGTHSWRGSGLPLFSWMRES